MMRIGTGAGYAGDRIEPAIELAEKGDIQYVVFECLAERTLAIAQLEKHGDPNSGYGQFLEERMEAMLPFCVEKGLVMISNMGAANPLAAMKKTVHIAEKMKARPLKVAAISGDDVFEKIVESDSTVWETGKSVSEIKERILSANAYLGVDAILPALEEGCSVIITGRVADPSLFLAPMVHEFGWSLDDWNRLGKGTAIAHLLECGAQVTGGYFADPGYKDVPNLLNVGFPIAEVDVKGRGVITKVAGSGGEVSVRTCKEQMLYEIHDPSEYVTPDVKADFLNITLTQDEEDRVIVDGATGKERPEELKVLLGVKEGYIGEGEISYAGQGALRRAQLSGSIIRERLKKWRVSSENIKIELIGYNSLLGSIAERSSRKPNEVRLRVAAKAEEERVARKVGEEVEALYLNGPAGPGGARKYVRPAIGMYSTGISRNMTDIKMRIVEI